MVCSSTLFQEMMGLKNPKTEMIIHMQVPQDEVTPEQQVSHGEDSCKRNSCTINQTQGYMPHEWMLLMGADHIKFQGHGISASLLVPRLIQSPQQHITTPPWNNHAFTLADETWLGDTQMFFRTHVFFPEQLPNKPKLLDIFPLTHLNESPNPRGSNSLLAEKQPYFKVENLWPKIPCTPGGKYYADVMPSERLECWNGHLL